MRLKCNKWILNGLKVICALLSTAALNYFFLYSTGNILNLIFLVSFTLLYKRYGLPDLKSRIGICACVGGMLISAIYSLGRIGRTNESLLDALSRFKESIVKDEYASVVSLTGYTPFPEKFVWLVMVFGLWLIFWFLLEQLMGYVEMVSQKVVDYTECSVKKRYFWIIVVIFIICWVPYLMINYPGALTVDSVNQISQIEGDIPLSNKHPLIHTGLIAVCWQWTKLLGFSSNAGVALYTVVQMFILASIYSYLVITLYKYGLRAKYCIYIVIYFALLPLNAMYAITMWKDVLFAGFVLWFSTLLFEIGVCNEKSKRKWYLLSISGFFMTMFRSNGMIAYILCLPYIFLILKKQWNKRMVIGICAPIALSWIITGPIYGAFHIEKGNIVEALSIPLQHIARVVSDCEEDLTESQIARIEQLAPIDDIKKVYNCRFADPMKILIWTNRSDLFIKENKWKFFQLWIELGLEHPKEYLLAEVDATLGYWYSEVQYDAMAIGGYPNEYGITWIFDVNPELWHKLYNWCNLYRSIPVLGCLYNMGSVFMLILVTILHNIALKQFKNLVVSIPAIMVWCTIMIAVPLHAEMRYVYGSMMCIPLIIGSNILSMQSKVG